MLLKHPLLWVIALLVAMFGIAGQLGNRSTQVPPGGIQSADKAEKTEDQQGSPSTAETDARPINDKRQTREYDPDCAERKDADLCAQRRMAEAAEAQTRLNEVGLWLLGFTLLATGAAAFYARRAALAARHTVGMMDDTAQRQLRAYVQVDSVSVTNLFGEAVFVVRMKNTGTTPAYDVEAHARVLSTPYPSEVNFSGRKSNRKPSVTILGAQGHSSLRLPTPMPMPDERQAALREGKDAVYVFGEITYTDIFRKPRRTTFRTMCGGDSGIVKDGPLANCEEGNSAT